VAPSSYPHTLAADEQIRIRAYELYRERGGAPGDDWSDWLRAEREYHERAALGAWPRTGAENPPATS
jgi:hypothetical protein